MSDGFVLLALVWAAVMVAWGLAWLVLVAMPLRTRRMTRVLPSGEHRVLLRDVPGRAPVYLTQSDASGLGHYGHYIPVGRGYTGAVVEYNYPGWSWNELVAAVYVAAHGGVRRFPEMLRAVVLRANGSSETDWDPRKWKDAAYTPAKGPGPLQSGDHYVTADELLYLFGERLAAKTRKERRQFDAEVLARYAPWTWAKLSEVIRALQGGVRLALPRGAAGILVDVDGSVTVDTGGLEHEAKARRVPFRTLPRSISAQLDAERAAAREAREAREARSKRWGLPVGSLSSTRQGGGR